MSDQYGPHSSGNLISDGKTTQPYFAPSQYHQHSWAEPNPANIVGGQHDPPLLYTQAQVDALVKAESKRCVRVAEAAKEGWKAYPDGGICDEIAARIREAK